MNTCKKNIHNLKHGTTNLFIHNRDGTIINFIDEYNLVRYNSVSIYSDIDYLNIHEYFIIYIKSVECLRIYIHNEYLFITYLNDTLKVYLSNLDNYYNFHPNVQNTI